MPYSLACTGCSQCRVAWLFYFLYLRQNHRLRSSQPKYNHTMLGLRKSGSKMQHVTIGACALSARTYNAEVQGSDARLRTLLTYLCLFARSEHRPSTKERHCFLSVAIFSISFQVYPISFVSFSVSLCQVFRGLPLLLFPGGFHVMA